LTFDKYGDEIVGAPILAVDNQIFCFQFFGLGFAYYLRA